MKRVLIVGTSGSGKTTLGRAIAQRLGVVHTELDALNFLPEWETRSPEEFRELVSAAVAQDRWVIDGNYSVARDILWSRATTWIWLNYSFPIVFSRVFRRTLRRSITGERLFAGNRESLAKAFLSRESILWWTIKTHSGLRREYRKLLSDPRLADMERIELRHPREADALLETLPVNP